MDGSTLDSYLFHREARPLFEAPRGEPPRGRALSFDATDGVALAATVFEGAPKPGAVVVIASATGVRRRFYARFAGALAARGFDVLTFDYRGIGESRRGDVFDDARLAAWGERDLAGAVAVARARGDGRVAVVGHSVGGQLVGLVPDVSPLCAVVTVASGSGDYRLWPLPERLAMALLWYGIVPGVTRTVGYLPGLLGIGEDLPKGVALEWARWCRTPGYVVGGGGGARRDGFAQVRCPVLSFGFDGDLYAPPSAVDALHALYANAEVTRRQVEASEGLGHFGFFREEGRALWPDVFDFVEAHAR